MHVRGKHGHHRSPEWSGRHAFPTSCHPSGTLVPLRATDSRMWMTATGCVLGIAAGMRHALEPDHLAAVSTFVSSTKAQRTCVPVTYAAAWGAGHALVLVLVGAVLFGLRTSMPERLSDTFELFVAIMLVVLGVRGLRRARARERTSPMGVGREHEALHIHGSNGQAQRVLPFVVGLTHGLAGSGALAAAVAASQPSPGLGLLTIGLYGAGAALGMVGLATVVALSLRTARGHREKVLSTVAFATSATSLVLGFVWGFPIVHRLVMAA
jgi:cytochrome c biogenesis protein CcdA